MEGASLLKQVKHGRRKYIRSVYICALTFDVETHFPLDITFGIPDSIATFICTRDSTEGDLALVGADSTLVAIPGHPCTGQQHQSRSAEGESHREQTYLNLFRKVWDTLSQCMHIVVGKSNYRFCWVKISVSFCWLYLDVWLASTALGLYSRVMGGVTPNSGIW